MAQKGIDSSVERGKVAGDVGSVVSPSPSVPTSKRDELLSRLRKRYPDKDFGDDEAFYGQILDDFDDGRKELDGYKEREKSFSDLFATSPHAAAFITAWRKGSDPTVELIRRFGPEIKDAIDNPDLQDKIAEANKEYVQRVEQSKALDAEYKKNIADTLSYLQGEVQTGRLSEQDIDDAFGLLTQIVHDGIIGKFSPATIDMALKALHHDADVEDADAEGEVRGRNEKISEQLARGRRGDGVPRLSGKNNVRGRSEKPQSIFDIAAGAE